MEPVSVNRTAVIVATQVEMLEPLVEAAGYSVVAAAEKAVNGEHLLAQLTPDVVVVENDLVGETGWDAIPHFRAASPSTQILLLVTDDWTPRDMASTGAFAFVTRNRLGELVDELDSLDDWIRAQAASADVEERRTGKERRTHQDWTKVGWERRNQTRRTVAG